MIALLTIPNSLTFLRLLGAPLFAYLALSRQADGWAIAVLAIGGVTDYLDGKLARMWGQTSRFGELADPAIDRIYILITLIVLVKRDALPLWIVVLLLARDALLGMATIALSRKGQPPLKVSFIGKAATFNLMYAFPFLLLATHSGWIGTLAFIFGWSFAGWGVTLYLFTGVQYFRNALRTIRVQQ